MNNSEVGHLNHVNHEVSIDYIKRVKDWGESTRARARTTPSPR